MASGVLYRLDADLRVSAFVELDTGRRGPSVAGEDANAATPGDAATKDGPPSAEKVAFMAVTAARTARTWKFWGCMPPGAGPRPIAGGT